MRIEIARDPRGSAEPESDVIAAVHAYRVDLGAVGARTWDAAGAPRFAALGAPMLVDSIALEGQVLRSTITTPMLRALTPLGFAGLGVVPGPLRRPLGVTRPLVRPAD